MVQEGRVVQRVEMRPEEYVGMERLCGCGRNSYAAIVETTVLRGGRSYRSIAAKRYCPGCESPNDFQRLTLDERCALSQRFSNRTGAANKLHSLICRRRKLHKRQLEARCKRIEVGRRG